MQKWAQMGDSNFNQFGFYLLMMVPCKRRHSRLKRPAQGYAVEFYFLRTMRNQNHAMNRHYA